MYSGLGTAGGQNLNLKPGVVGWTIGLIVVFIFTLITYCSTVVTIPQGHVGVVYDVTRGGILQKELQPGWNAIWPFIQSVTEYPVALRTYTMAMASGEGAREGDDSVKVTTSDNQILRQDISVTYKIMPGWAPKIFNNFKGAHIGEIENSFIRRSIITATATMAGTQFQILEAYGVKKPDFEKKISEELDRLLKQQGFEVVIVNLGEGHIDPTVKASIEAPLKAQTLAKEAEAQLAMKRAQAQQQVIDAQAYSDATKIRSTAEAEANHRVSASLTPMLLEKIRIDKLNPNVQMIIPSDSKLITGLKGVTE